MEVGNWSFLYCKVEKVKETVDFLGFFSFCVQVIT